MQAGKAILDAKQVVLTACGTSRYAALIGRYIFSRLAGKLSDVVMASEFGYFIDSIDEDTLIIAISQSGETADVIQGVRKAKENGAKIISLINVVGSTLARMSDEVIYLNCGPEVAVAATKSFINQLAIFYILAFAATSRIEEGIKNLKEISYFMSKVLDENNHKLSRLVRSIRGKVDFYYIARGINYAIAGEGALKLKEISYIHAEGLPAGELKHGTLALIEEGTPVVVICPNDYTYNATITNATETKARGAFIIGVSDKPAKVFNHWIKIPTVEEVFYPLVAILPLQLLAYHLAVTKGLDPDKPRNLAKSVTVL
jgi:glucosamine--fructose-6-phosphate aminotransferase (isomerizing)